MCNATMSTPMMMGFNVMRMATIGLASLYMIHLLALDYMHIQKVFRIAPAAMVAARALFRSRRDLSSPHSNSNLNNISVSKCSHDCAQTHSAAGAAADFDDFEQIRMPNITTLLHEDILKVNWNRVLQSDPFNCIPLLTCQLIAGAEADSVEGKNIKHFIELSYSSAPDAIQYAYNRGLIFSNKSDMCYAEYPFCIYSAKLMLRLLKFFIDIKR